MSNFPLGLSQDLVVEILISNVRVMRTISGYSTYTDKQHHGIDADMLSSKWGIGLDKANYTLQSTTQDNRSRGLHPRQPLQTGGWFRVFPMTSAAR